MELYLGYSDLPIVLTKPGLLDIPTVQVGTTNVTGANAGPNPQANDVAAPGTAIESAGDDAGKLRIDTADGSDWGATTQVRYRTAGGAFTTLPADQVQRDGSHLTVTFPLEAQQRTLEYEIFTPAVAAANGNPATPEAVVADGRAPVPGRTAAPTPEGAPNPSAPGTVDPNAPTARHNDTPDGNQTTTVRQNLTSYEQTTESRMETVFNDGTTAYWAAGTDFTRANIDGDSGLLSRLRTRRDAMDGLIGNATGPARQALVSERQWLDDRIARATSLAPIAERFTTARTDLANGRWETGRDFYQTYGTSVQGVGSQSITSAHLDTTRRTGDINDAQEQREDQVAGTQSGGRSFVDGVNGVTNGANAVGGMVNSFAGVGNSIANVGYAGRNVGAAFGSQSAYGGYGGYGSSYGGPGGLGGGFGGVPGLGLRLNNSQDDHLREESRGISVLLYQLMHAIQMGNLDAIPTALTMISLRGKRTLLQAAGRAVRAMESFERQQQGTNEQMAALSSEGNPNYASNLQTLTHQMNQYSNNRQAIVNFLRDIKSMSDELENMEKSWLDVDLRQGRQQMSWNA